MSIITSRDFNQDVSAAKRAEVSAPVIITERGKPLHDLVSVEDYDRLISDRRSIVDGCQPTTTLIWSPNVSICH